ncbi:peroxidase [Rhodobacteraceae bacterium NNCM2]|nr:peroxidase [Coraliihabitans acroporae]
MTRQLNLDDIQGNVIRAYGKFGYPKARYFFLNLTNAWVGRRFTGLVIDKITTARRWDLMDDPLAPGKKVRVGPDITMNIGFTFMGLYMMELPTRTLQSMPDDFIDGMRKRAFILGDKPPSDINRPEQPVMPGDDYPTWMKNWDHIWKENRSRIGATDVHIWISMNAKVVPGTEEPVTREGAEINVLDERTKWLEDTCAQVTNEYLEIHEKYKAKRSENSSAPDYPRGMIRILTLDGKPDGPKYQAASAVFDDITMPDGKVARLPTPYEHFELSDGIGDPVFEGQFEDAEMATKVLGRGKWMSPERGWEPLATGEFLLGHPDESQELPPAARPPEFSTNGTFMAFRKLHENVKSFFDYLEEKAPLYAEVSKSRGEGYELTVEQAKIELKSKIVGRWPDGVSLTQAGDYPAWKKVREKYNLTCDKDFESWRNRLNYLKNPHASDFKYAHDMQGYDNPNTSHVRRVNTRDYLDPQNEMHPELYVDPETGKKNPNVNENATTQLNKRRRVLRRGLPYGESSLYDGKNKTDETEQGVAMMILCANLFRQFEFVQQQWIQYGLDFNSGNNTCPLVGDHGAHNRFTIPNDPAKGGCPFVLDGMKNFVEPRGGEYFFIPSMTALRMIADGIVDPT